MRLADKPQCVHMHVQGEVRAADVAVARLFAQQYQVCEVCCIGLFLMKRTGWLAQQRAGWRTLGMAV